MIDEQTIYDPGNGDDKLLLDLKGTMSEAELHWLRLRLEGARRSKARRGELWLRPPTGYIWGDGRLELDPDEAVQCAIRTVFERFAVEPSARAVVVWAREQGLKVPTRHYFAGGSSEVTWDWLDPSRVRDMLNSPVYAGVYAWGRRPSKEVLVDGEIRRVREPGDDPERWLVRIEDAHPAYITWETYLKNREKLRANSSQRPSTGSAPREGPALLAGLVLCGRCGRRMRMSYGNGRSDYWSYTCPGEASVAGPRCWSVPGLGIDAAAETLFLEMAAPSEVELCLAVEREASLQTESLAKQWRVRIERAEYEARLAERRYKAVDPDNRVVARSLERDWELKLRELEDVRANYDTARRRHHVELTEADRARIRELARDLPTVWRSETTKPEERKAMLREVIQAISLAPVEIPERVTLVKVQFKSGTVTELRVPRPRRGEHRRTPAATRERIRKLVSEGETKRKIAETLNREGQRTATGKSWTKRAVESVCRQYDFKGPVYVSTGNDPLPDRYPDGRYSVLGVARRFGVDKHLVHGWIRRGLITGDRDDYGSYRNIWRLDVDEATASRLEQSARRLRKMRESGVPKREPLPERHPDGRYSLPGAARRFGVSQSAVHGWIRRGLAPAVQENFGGFRGAWWLTIDEATAARLEQAADPEYRSAQQSARRAKANRLPDRYPDERYSVPGVSKWFDVSKGVVLGWITQGLVSGKKEKYQNFRSVWRLDIDEETAARLERAARRYRSRTSREMD